MKGLVGKTALAAAVVAGPIVAISTGTADATPVWGGAQAYASPWWQHPQWTNLQIAQAWGPSNLYNEVTAESLHGCVGCTALAVNFQIDLVSYTAIPPNELDVANAIDKGVSNDQNLAAAAMFVVTSPGRLSLSGRAGRSSAVSNGSCDLSGCRARRTLRSKGRSPPSWGR